MNTKAQYALHQTRAPYTHVFSFGPIKYATAFQGAVATVRDGSLLRRMRHLHQSWPVQSRVTYLWRCIKFTVYVLLQRPAIIGTIMWLLKILGFDHQKFFVWLVRSFPVSGPRRYGYALGPVCMYGGRVPSISDARGDALACVDDDDYYIVDDDDDVDDDGGVVVPSFR